MTAIAALLLSCPIRADAEDILFEFAVAMGGVKNDYGLDFAMDSSGNVYATGAFDGTVDFDPGPGIVNLSSGPASAAFVWKLNSAGQLIWARSLPALGGTGNSIAFGIALDESGNVYLSGSFSGTVDFDPGPGTHNISSVSIPFNIYRGADIFICKLDPDGDFVWAKTMGSMGINRALAIASDGIGNIYFTGTFMRTLDFDPGVAVASISSAGFADIFVSKWDSAGNFTWAKSFRGEHTEQPSSIAVDASGGIYTTGAFHETVDFNPGFGTANRTSAGGLDLFISKLDSEGAYVWAKAIGGASIDYGNDILVDGSGNIYLSGYVAGPVDVDPGPDVVPIHDLGGIAIKMASSGNLVWARPIGETREPIGSTGGTLARGLAVDGSGNVYTTGHYKGIVDFDPGSGDANLISKFVGNSSNFSRDIFVSKLDSAGNFRWVKSLGGDRNDIGYAIASHGTGCVYVIGGFRTTSDFDPHPILDFKLTSKGDTDVFVLKLGYSRILPVSSEWSLLLLVLILCTVGIAFVASRIRRQLSK